MLSHGAAAASAVGKNEDRWTALEDAAETRGWSGYAIFDGHGGASAAVGCADDTNGLLPKLAKVGSKIDQNALQDIFWEMDAALGPQIAANSKEGQRAARAIKGAAPPEEEVKNPQASVAGGAGSTRKNGGTTASVLIVGERDQSGTRPCVLSWVGDSTAICVDMTAAPKSDKLIIAETDSHLPSRSDEAERLKLMVDTYRKINSQLKDAGRNRARESNAEILNEDETVQPVNAGSNQAHEPKTDITRTMVSDALDVLANRSPPEQKKEFTELFLRACERETLINLSLPQGSKVTPPPLPTLHAARLQASDHARAPRVQDWPIAITHLPAADMDSNGPC